VSRQVRQGDLVRAARRITTAPANDPDREAATERVMTAALREALGSADVAVRRAAVEGIGRAKVLALAEDVRGLLGVTTDLELRLAAIDTAGELADREAAPPMLAQLPIDLAEHDRLAAAETRVLVKLERTDDATKAIRALLDADGATPHPIAVRALAFDPIPGLAGKLAKWFDRGDARTRAAVCAALSGGAPAWGQILRGLRDADATVRATCADSAGKQRRGGAKPPGDVVATLRELARDRDAAVRAKAITAAGNPIRAVGDPAPEVRIAAAAVASLADLKVLVEDKDPDVRAAAVAACAAIPQAKELAVKQASHPASQVRRAAVGSLDDDPVLARLVADDAPEVATVALVRLAGLRGRAAMTTPLLVRVAAGAPRSAERMRSALAWLLAR
jgi:HEAT repeat protein